MEPAITKSGLYLQPAITKSGLCLFTLGSEGGESAGS